MGFTANKNLEQVARGADVGTWDTPTNSNWGIVDLSLGGVSVVPLTNAPVTLSAAQYQCNFITFTGALSGNCAITFPAVGSFYTVQNLTSNTSTFQVTLLTTVGGGQAIGCPPGEAADIFTDGTNVRFRDLGRIGTYWDYAGSSVPWWVSACTVPPYLNCDGTAFSSATYPVLATILGGTTLPDSKGRTRFTLNQGTARITSSGGLDGNTLLAGGGVQTITLSTQNIPNYALPVTDPGHAHVEQTVDLSGGIAGPQTAAGSVLTPRVNSPTVAANTGITVNSGGGGVAIAALPSGYVGGITLVRAA